MPIKTGFDVLNYLHDHNYQQEFPVIIITSSTDSQDELKAFSMGADEMIRKPFVPEIVMRRAENLIELYSSRKELRNQLSLNTQELQYTKKYDLLTGLFNKQYFTQECDLILKSIPEKQYDTCAFIYTNIRNFRYLNLKVGMEQGDTLLRNCAFQFQNYWKESICSRYAQDHFVLFVHDENIEDALKKATKEFDREYGNLGLSLKFGVYYLEKEEVNTDFAAECAKVACDSIRDSSLSVCVFNKKLRSSMDIHSYVIQHIDEAIENGYIQVYLQPVIRTINGKTCGMEALVRWIDPVKGFLSSADFISTLEDNRLITKLDLYVLKEVCRGMKKVGAEGKVVVPISFNLSRIDFEEWDIFEEVDKIVMDYGIPRDMINVEITESMIMNDPDAFKQEIERFRSAGYQVWMDDFGSGYSSLNVLKEYKFDEIKLDMKFISSLDQESKEIVKSIISMAKNIGIYTLAEGVETKEQYEFLRSIGCEKVQGYYFSKPLSPQALEQIDLIRPHRMEQRSWKTYYEQLGSVNFLTERPLSIVEYDGEQFNLLYANDSCHNVWDSIGNMSIEEVYSYMNVSSSSLGRQFKELRLNCHMGQKPREVYFTSDGCYVRLEVKCISECRSRSAFEVEVFNISGSNIAQKRTLFESTSRSILAMFDTILSFNLDNNRMRVIQQGTYRGKQPVFDNQSIENNINEAIQLILPRDREEFREFIDITTLRDRLQGQNRTFITKHFRTLTYNGAYVWKSHTILHQTESDMYLYCTRLANFNEKLIEKLIPESKEKESTINNLYKLIQHGVLESKIVNIFWKDKDRRFLGANEAFLSTYGFDDISEIVGKTDEDMGWHINNEPFADDERRVIENGEVLSNRLGKCIIKGVACNIVASKEPLYENGEIVGLMGYFVNVDDIKDILHISPSHDSVTNLLSPHSLIDLVSEYSTEWHIHNENYAMISVIVQELKRINLTYGEIVVKSLLKEVAQILTEIVGYKGSCSRMYAGHFVILMKCQDKTYIEQAVQTLKDRLSNIREMCGYKITVRAQVEIAYADQKDSMLHMLQGFGETPFY